MKIPKLQPVKSIANLRDRVDRLFNTSAINTNNPRQFLLDLPDIPNKELELNYPSKNIADFMSFITDAMPSGDVYLFGGIIRDLALLGRKGFNSDIDLVVEGNWTHFVSYLESLNAHKNKFGGYRLIVGGWPVDIWNAEETWAIKNGLVLYNGVSSLTDTTVLNWDAILIDWRTRKFICRNNYFEELNSRVLDIILVENPNPLGMAIRVFRHFCLKDAKQITPRAVKFMANCAKNYSFEELTNAEIKSYNNTLIKQAVHDFFKHIDTSKNKSISHEFSLASKIIEQELSLAIK